MSELERFLQDMASGAPVAEGTEAHRTMCALSAEAQRVTRRLNGAAGRARRIRRFFSKLTGKKVDATFRLFPPFYTDCGKNITVGRGVFINSGCCFQDQGGIVIGDGALIGHQVVLATLNHGLRPADRASLLPAPIAIGRNVWIGAHATILPGVTVGDDAVVAAGAVVTKNVPPGAVVAGVPARVIKQVPNEKRTEE